jgi:hypothetical protein
MKRSIAMDLFYVNKYGGISRAWIRTHVTLLILFVGIR